MITKLNKQQYYKVRHITDYCKNIEAKAVVNGSNPGAVYVDDPAEITAALIWLEGLEGFHLVGEVNSQSFLTGLEEYIRIYIEPSLKLQGINVVEIAVDSHVWDRTMQTIFSKRSILGDIQHVYRLSRHSQPDLFIANEIPVQMIDQNLLDSKHLMNRSFVEEKILRFWGTFDSFLQSGFGFIAKYDNRAVSICLSSFVADQIHAVDIETIEKYRRRNYGVAVARAYVQECIQREVVTYWDCTPENKGSNRLATSIGLSLDFNYKVYWYEIS